jgi:pimeloyl-ACP methyl ester carboxylesterase
MRRLVAVFACVALVGLGAGTARATRGRGNGDPALAASIDWSRCDDTFLRASGARCGMLSVPLDHANPSGEQIRIAVSRVKHTVADGEYQGVMLTNPGGPGGSGLWMSVLGRFVPDHAGDAYDWIGFDPRGVGSSRPALSCLPRYMHGDRPPYVPRRQALVDAWLARTRKYADACEASAAELLPHMTTVDAARDMDLIRQALGADQINYYGFSYGTYLGQVYNTVFPGMIRRAVLDGVVDPRDVWYQANLNQDVAFDRNLRIWFAWLARYSRVYRLGGTEASVARRYAGQERALRRHPAGGVVGPDEWDDIFLSAGYAQFLWPSLGNVFASWVRDGSKRPLIRAYRQVDAPGNDNSYAVYLAVECTDAPWPLEWQTWADDNWAIHDVAPLITWANAWFNAPCLSWAAPAATPTEVVGGSTPALLVSEELDAATPHAGAVYVRSLFQGSALIAEPGGTTHAGSLGGNECVDGAIADFLSIGVLPHRQPGVGPDLSCEPLPPPNPAFRARIARTPARWYATVEEVDG